MWLFCLLDPGQIRYRAIYTHPNQIRGYASGSYRKARYCHRKWSVRLSVTMTYRGHWPYSLNYMHVKIHYTTSLEHLLRGAPTLATYSERNFPKFRVEYVTCRVIQRLIYRRRNA